MAVTVTSCVRPPKPTGYLKDYSRLIPLAAPYATVHAERTEAARKPRIDHVLQVLPAHWEATHLDDPARETHLLQLLDYRFYVYLLRAAPQPVIITQRRDVEDYLEAGVNVTQVRLAITDVERGTGLVRMLIGFYLGAVQLQVEGQMVDYKTQQTLARFARRGYHDGVVWGLPTPWALSPFYCWRLSIDQTAALLGPYVASQLTPPPPRWWDLPEFGEPPLPN